MKLKFVQITADNGNLFGLDAVGRVWVFKNDGSPWKMIWMEARDPEDLETPETLDSTPSD